MKKSTNRMLRSAMWILAALAAILIAACAWGANQALSKHSGEDTRIYLPSGSSGQAVADTLKAHFGPFGEKAARLWSIKGGDSAGGSYVVPKGATAISVARMLYQGRQTPVRVTFNNCRTMADVAERVARFLEITPEEFLQACDTVLPARGFTREEFPAAFLPDTYEMYWNAAPEAVVTKLTGYRDRFWTDARRGQAKSLGLTPAQVATLASIVEEETAKADERPIVARLYLNRLNRGMLLQADPTVKFAVGDFTLRRILSEHLSVDSPYNTYKHRGLPPGPIRVANASTLDAVLNAPAHNYLYMCAKEDFSGYHNFTDDYSTHLANARRYRAALDRRGIR